MSEVKLKSCPFCWGEAEHRNGSRTVECSICYAGFYGDTENEAIIAWNRRVETDEKIKLQEIALDDLCVSLNEERSETEKWKKAFAAQSRKLEAVLQIPGVKERLATLVWSDE